LAAPAPDGEEQAKEDRILHVSAVPQEGHETSRSLSKEKTICSNSLPHWLHLNSYMGISVPHSFHSVEPTASSAVEYVDNIKRIPPSATGKWVPKSTVNFSLILCQETEWVMHWGAFLRREFFPRHSDSTRPHRVPEPLRWNLFTGRPVPIRPSPWRACQSGCKSNHLPHFNSWTSQT
jgi:hypothetical protein